ncbi:hypothetical protein Cgig2_024711 [Carnegiea gigantea]|uniref:Uncharacterized protein n=1 Tax=Carnegiea gigantea TaxID=171969 RepID=A0A9Q1JE83_9CARY|nr:hypothetical protein Cgig2_024711 [Carnegiea gigantea]
MHAQCSASRSTARGHSPSRVRTATRRGWTTAPARRVHPTPQGGIERKIISLGSKLPSRGMQPRKPSSVQGLPAPGSSPEEDREWTVHRSSREPANTNENSRAPTCPRRDAPALRGSASGLARAYKLKRSRPSLTIKGFSQPGRSAHPASPLLSPRLRRSARTWKATRLRANPTARRTRRPPRDASEAKPGPTGWSRIRPPRFVPGSPWQQGFGTSCHAIAMTWRWLRCPAWLPSACQAPPPYLKRALITLLALPPGPAASVPGAAAQRSRACGSVQDKRQRSQGCGLACTSLCGQRSRTSGQRHHRAAAQALHSLRTASRTSGQLNRAAGTAFTACGQLQHKRPAFTRAQRAFVAVPGVDINRADFSYSARAIPLESFRRFGGRARSGHQPCLFFILRPDHPPRELQEVWRSCPEWTSTVPIFHTQLGQVTACGQRSQAIGQRSQDSGQRSQAAASVQDKRPAFTGCGQRSGQAASVQRLRPAFRTCGQRSQAAASVQDKRPAFTGCGQRSQAAASVQDKRPAFTCCGQRSQAAASVQDKRPAFTGRGQRSGQAASVHRLRPAFTGCGQRSGQAASRSQPADSVHRLRPAFRTSGQRSQAAASVQDTRPAFTGCGQRSGQAASVQDKRPAFTTCGQRSQAAASVQDKRPAFMTSGQRSQPAASVHRLRPAFRTSGQRSGQAASVHRLRPAFRPSGQRSQAAASVQDKRPAFTACGHRSQAAASVQDKRPAFTGCGQRSGQAASVHSLRPAFTGCGQRSGQAASVHRLRPAFRTSGQRSQAEASVHRLRPAFRTSGQRSQAAASVQDKPPAFRTSGQRSQPAASVHRLRPAFRTSGQRSQAAASVHRLRPAEERLMGHLASTAWKQCPHSVLHPEAQPEAIAQAACARRRDAGGRRPQPEGSTRHPKGASSERSSR